MVETTGIAQRASHFVQAALQQAACMQRRIQRLNEVWEGAIQEILVTSLQDLNVANPADLEGILSAS